MLNIVMPRLGLRIYESDKDRFFMHKVMMGERVNLPEVIFFYWLQASKDIFHAKDKKNLVPYGMFFTQIMRNSGVDVFVLKPFAGGTQHRGLTFVKM